MTAGQIGGRYRNLLRRDPDNRAYREELKRARATMDRLAAADDALRL